MKVKQMFVFIIIHYLYVLGKCFFLFYDKALHRIADDAAYVFRIAEHVEIRFAELGAVT